MIDKLKLIGFSEIEAMVYIHLLKNPGDNGTQISKKLGVSRSACYNSLIKLENENIIKLLPSDNDRKNYKVFNPNLMLDEKKKNFEKTIKDLEYELFNIYEKYAYEEVYNIERKDNYIYKVFDMIDNCETVLHIIGKIDIEEINKKLYEKENVIKIEIKSDNNEFILLKDNIEIIIIDNNRAIYTKNNIIIKQISNRVKLEMEKNR